MKNGELYASQSYGYTKLEHEDSFLGLLPHHHATNIQPIGVIGTLGPAASQSHIATLDLAHTLQIKDYEINFFENFSNVAEGLKENKCTHILLPLKNNLSGVITQTTILLPHYTEFEIAYYFTYKVKFSLIGFNFSKVREIFSHEQAFKQCQRYLRANFQAAIENYCSSTSKAAQEVAKRQDESFAAIANPEAAKVYHLTKLAGGIEDVGSYTTFVMLQRSK